jgi:hypothetical protein
MFLKTLKSGIGILFFIVWSALTAYAQLRLTGVVQFSENSAPAERATVTLHAQSDSTVLAFSLTDPSGQFVILWEPSTTRDIFLKVSYLGYKTVYQAIAQADTTRYFEFGISSEYLQLREVVVNSRPPAQVRGDTTAYKIKTYNKGEKNLEEVLKKMPGISVGENGELFFKGKKVNKVLLDGDDIVGANYQLATRSLDPSVLNEVQAIENHSSNKQLRDIEKSEELILNLRVNDDRKRLLFGHAGIALGPRAHSLSTNVFSYHQAFKNFSTVTSNNIGIRQAEPLAQNISSPFGQDVAALFTVETVLPMQGYFSRNLRATYENINREQNASFNAVVTPGNRFKLVYNGFFQSDHNRALQNTTTSLLQSPPTTYHEMTQLSQKPNQTTHYLQADWDIADNTGIQVRGFLGNGKLPLWQSIIFRVASQQESFSQLFKNHHNTTNINFDLTHKINEKNAFVFSLSNARRHVKEELVTQLGTDVVEKLIYDPVVSGNSPFEQVINHQKTVYRVEAKWLRAMPYLTMENSVSVTDQTYELDVEQSYPLSDNNSKLSIHRQLGSFTNQLKWSKKSFKLGLVQQLDGQNVSLSSEKEIYWRWQGRASASLTTGAYSNLTLLYDYSSQPLLNYLSFAETLVIDFRSLQRGQNKIVLNNQSQVSFSYTFSDIFSRKLSYSLTLFSLHNPTQWNLMAFELQPRLSYASLLRTSQNAAQGIVMKTEKLVYPLRGSILINLNAFLSTYESLINGERRISRSVTNSVRYRYSSVFESNFNLEVGGYFQSTRFEVKNRPELLNSFPMSNHSITLRYHAQKLTGKVLAENFSINRNSYLFINARADYDLKKRISLRIEVKNLLNIRSYRQVELTQTAFVQDQYSLLGRLALGGLSFSF